MRRPARWHSWPFENSMQQVSPNRAAFSAGKQVVLGHHERRGRRGGILARLRGNPCVHRALHLGSETSIDERLFIRASCGDGADKLEKHGHVDDFEGIGTTGSHGSRDTLGRSFVVFPGLKRGPPRRLVAAPRRQHRGSRDQNDGSEIDPDIERGLAPSDRHAAGLSPRAPALASAPEMIGLRGGRRREREKALAGLLLQWGA